MPRADRTFNDSDLIRVFETQLSLSEQDEVRRYFRTGEIAKPVDIQALEALLIEGSELVWRANRYIGFMFSLEEQVLNWARENVAMKEEHAAKSLGRAILDTLVPQSLEDLLDFIIESIDGLDKPGLLDIGEIVLRIARDMGLFHSEFSVIERFVEGHRMLNHDLAVLYADQRSMLRTIQHRSERFQPDIFDKGD